MTHHRLAPLIKLIETNTGLLIREPDLKTFSGLIQSRVKALSFGSAEDYYQFLALSCRSSGTRSSLQPATRVENEWKLLIDHLTIGESYFFRDEHQFSLLRTRILPELIHHKTQQRHTRPGLDSQLGPKSLKVWSAGCSTGEEAYSLAIVLKELVPEWQPRTFEVFGTDINYKSIEKAKQGVYSDWSFRQAQPQSYKKYFRLNQEKWQVDSQIQSLVHFKVVNLIQDSFPNPSLGLADFDLIICRNVFIYFSSTAVDLVLEKFYRSLRPGGYLMTGHTELQGQNTANFQIKSFPESILYQRPATAAQDELNEQNRRSSPLPSLIRHSVQPSVHGSKPHQLSKTGQRSPERQITPFPNHLKKAIEPSLFESHLESAKNHANASHYTAAQTACQEALRLQPFAIQPYYILAHIAEERNDLEAAKGFFKKIIYLDPNAVLAYLELAALYEREGNLDRAKKTRNIAAVLLESLPLDFQVDAQRQITVHDLKQHLEQVKNL